MSKIIIVGGGISGLSIAYRLQTILPEAEITILESNSHLGGTVSTVHRDGYCIEEGPNGFLDSKPSTLQLCRDLGIENNLVQGSEAAGKNRYLFLADKLQLLPNSLGSFLSSKVLTWRGKLSVLGERFRKNKGPEQDESIADFAMRRAGKEMADILADAMVTGIYAGDPKLLSVRACFPRIASLEQEYGSVLKGFIASAKKRRAEAKARGIPHERGGKLWSLRRGLGFLIQSLAERLRQPPHLKVRVKDLGAYPTNDAAIPGWRVNAEDGREFLGDCVILACPAYAQAKIVHQLDPVLSGKMESIPYNRVAVLGLGYRRSEVPISLDGFGFIAPENRKRDILGVQWCSSIYPERAPNNMVLLRAMCGGWTRGEILDWDDKRLLDAMCEELRLAMGIRASPSFVHLVRWPLAIPQYHLGHLDRVADIEMRVATHPGLFVAGNAYHGVALNDCTEQGGIVAEKVRQFLEEKSN